MTTPNDVLQQYRDHAEPRMQEEAASFRALSAADQRELLFWMAMSNGAMINHLTVILGQTALPKETAQ